MNDGGAAFPAELSSSGPQFGMSLRDYFASNLLPIFAERLDPALHFALERSIDHGKILAETAAQMSYFYADAMIAERAKVTT